VAASVFWIISIIDATQDRASTILATCLESAFDFFSTALVIWRFSERNALELTPQNELSESRTSVLLSVAMIAIGGMLVGFSAFSLVTSDEKMIDRHKLGEEVALSFPSAIVYLIIGMLQVNMGMVMRVRSLRQDGVISITGAIVSLGALLAALINLISCEYTEYIELPAGDETIGNTTYHSDGGLPETDPTVTEPRYRINTQEPSGHALTGAPLFRAILHHASSIEGKEDGSAIINLHHHVRYPYYWCEDAITISLALVIIMLGVHGLLTDARMGVRWWSASFWCSPAPDAESTSHEPYRKGHGTEATPLVKA